MDDEVLLVDDRSTDDGPAIAAGLASKHAPRIRLLAAPSPGISAALMTGLAAARGDFVARMDADDVSLPGRLVAERRLLEADPSLAAAACLIEVFGAPGEGIERFAAWQNGLVTADDHARSIFVEAPVCHPSTMLRRSALEAVGGWRTGPFAEDYDLWLRLFLAGWGIAKVPEVLFRWRIHGANTTWNDERLSFESLRSLRAMHLAEHLKRQARPFAMWGAGTAGRRLARALAGHGHEAAFFIDIDPKKIGSTRRGRPIVTAPHGLARIREENLYLVAAVAQRGARDIVRGRLTSAGFVELRDFVCAA